MRTRLWLVIAGLLVLAAACGDDAGVFSTGAGSTTTGGSTTTTTTRAVTTTTRAVTTTTTTAPTTTSALGAGDLADAIAANMVVEDGSPFDEEAAECFARGAVEEIGEERLRALGVGEPGSTNEDFLSQLTEAEVGTIADVALGCLDMHALFVDQFVAVGLPQEAAVCIADGLSGAPFVRDLVVATLRGEEADPMKNPEAVSLITDLVTQCMAG